MNPNSLEKRRTKVLCALSHGLYEPWLSILTHGQACTWLTDDFPDNFTVIHFHATPVGEVMQKFDKIHESIRWRNIWMARTLRELDNFFTWPLLNYIPVVSFSELLKQKHPSIHVHFPDTYMTYRWKLLALLKYFLEETDADFLFTTTTASYVQPSLVTKHIESLPKTGVYAGAEPYLGAGFASGSNRIFSRNIADQIIQNRVLWKTGTIEDVAVSNLVKSLGNSLNLYPILNISSLEELNHISDNTIESSYHFRLKSGPLNNRKDVEIMKQLHFRVRKLR